MRAKKFISAAGTLLKTKSCPGTFGNKYTAAKLANNL